MADAPSSPPGAGGGSSQGSLSPHEEILLRSAIRRILDNADLSSISAKNVREELISIQQRQSAGSSSNGSANGGMPFVPPSLDIMSHKKQVNTLVKQCFEEVSAQKEQEAAAAAALAAVSYGGNGSGSGAWGASGSRSTFAAGGIALPGIGAAPPVARTAPPPQARPKTVKKENRIGASGGGGFPSRSASSPSGSAATPNGYGDDDIEAELAELDDDTGVRRGGKKAKSSKSKLKVKAKREPNPNNPFNRPLLLSAPMAEICGSKELSRPQVVKQLWAYIKGNELQNPDNKRQILCDAKLNSLFGKSMVDSFEMAKLIGKHLQKKEDD